MNKKNKNEGVADNGPDLIGALIANVVALGAEFGNLQGSGSHAEKTEAFSKLASVIEDAKALNVGNTVGEKAPTEEIKEEEE